MYVTLLGRPYEKIRKRRCQYSWQFQKKVSQRGLGSHRPHGTRPGLIGSIWKYLLIYFIFILNLFHMQIILHLGEWRPALKPTVTFRSLGSTNTCLHKHKSINHCSLPNYVRWFLGAFAKLRKATISCVMSVRPPICPRETIRFPLDGLSLNLKFEYFSKKCPENSGLIKIQQE